MMFHLRHNWFSFEYLCSITMETFILAELFRKDFIFVLREVLSEYWQIDGKQLKHKLPTVLITV